MSFEFPDDGGFDQLALEKSVRLLCKTSVRRPPFTVENVKIWVNQFDGVAEKALAWLLLRHLVYRTAPQLESSLRQALKAAATHFLNKLPDGNTIDWKDALAGKASQIKFFCGPPGNEYTPPGKSGEVITRVVNRNYGIGKWYPNDATTLDSEDRYLILDDGTYTGDQLIQFLDSWQPKSYSNGKVAIVVGFAHKQAIEVLQNKYPEVPLFAGEILTEQNSFNCLSEQWVRNGQWPISEVSPLEVYLDIYRRKGPFSKNGPMGYGSLGLMVAFEHGVPDDSLQLLWDRSANWVPLIER